ncbi:MAG: hypothetical protein ACPGN3_08680 [Opitutales bacterium]
MTLVCVATLAVALASAKQEFKLPPQESAYLSGDQVLNNEMNWPESPAVEYSLDDSGYRGYDLSEVPAPGIHPRILMSPEDIPDVRSRLENTEAGRAKVKYVNDRLNRTIYKAGTKYERAYRCLVAGDFAGFKKIDDEEVLGNTGHYQRAVIFEIMLQSFMATIFEDEVKGKESAIAITTWAEGMIPVFEKTRVNNDNQQRGGHSVYQWLGFTYDFAYNFMSDAQRDRVRSVISLITKNAFIHGMELPPHFRVWNWMNVSNHFTLLALAIEGEEGYEERLYPKAIEVFMDYITRNYSKKGSSTEAAGYTTFGWRWGAPMLIAAARRGDHLAIIDRYREISKWHAAVTHPNGKGVTSHGDGGDTMPSREEIQIMKYLYPDDPIIDYNWQNFVLPVLRGKRDNPQIIAPMICAIDGMKDENGDYIDYNFGKALDLPETFYDEERGNLIARSGYYEDAVFFNMEARTDTFYVGHQHADRGNFSLFAHGKNWSPESFRSVESHYHNIVLIDGKGQGMWTPPADWMKKEENEFSVFGICKTDYAYAWWWPKGIVGTDLSDAKFEMERFSGYKTVVDFIQNNYDWEYETHPQVIEHFEGFVHPNAKMWDEDGWTVRIPHNPVQRAYRTAGLVKGEHPYLFIADDIQKDDQVRLYEWVLMLSLDTVPVSITEKFGVSGTHSHPLKFGYEEPYTDILLADTDTPVRNGKYRPKKGDPLLLVRVLNKSEPGIELGYDTRGNVRVETFEKKDKLQTSGGRSFGLDRRLIVPSRSVSPDFRILIYPHRFGDPLPETHWSNETQELKITIGAQSDSIQLKPNGEGIEVTRL